MSDGQPRVVTYQGKIEAVLVKLPNSGDGTETTLRSLRALLDDYLER